MRITGVTRSNQETAYEVHLACGRLYFCVLFAPHAYAETSVMYDPRDGLCRLVRVWEALPIGVELFMWDDEEEYE